MATATQLVITLTDSTTVTVTIAAAVQTLDSNQAGYFGPDVTIASIFKRGYFWNDAKTQAWSAAQIKSITYQ